jgi:hypothetical protein
MSIWNREIRWFKKTDNNSNAGMSSVLGKKIRKFLFASAVIGVALMLLELIYLKVSGLL